MIFLDQGRVGVRETSFCVGNMASFPRMLRYTKIQVSQILLTLNIGIGILRFQILQFHLWSNSSWQKQLVPCPLNQEGARSAAAQILSMLMNLKNFPIRWS